MSSIRNQILCAIEKSFGQMQIGGTVTGLPDPFTTEFSKITRAPLDAKTWAKDYSLGIHDQTERKTRKTMFYYCTLPVVIEFRYLRQTDEFPSEEMNRVLYDVQRWLALDYTWGGLAINTEEISSDLYLDDEDQKRLSGAVFVDITYRHFWNDPSRTH